MLEIRELAAGAQLRSGDDAGQGLEGQAQLLQVAADDQLPFAGAISPRCVFVRTSSQWQALQLAPLPEQALQLALLPAQEPAQALQLAPLPEQALQPAQEPSSLPRVACRPQLNPHFGPHAGECNRFPR